MAIISFDRKLVQEKEQEFSKVVLPPELKDLVEQQVDYMSTKIPISKLALKGFSFYAIKAVQEEFKIKASDYTKLSKTKLKEAMSKVNYYLKESLKKVLLNKSPEQLKILDDIFNELEKSDDEFIG